MREYFKLAWRNIWRNKRRTIITISSVFFAMFFALIMRSIQVGTYDSMIKGVLENYTGYIQIHKSGYFEDPTLDNSFSDTNDIEKSVQAVENIKAVIPRLESYGLASNKDNSKGIMLLGIDPEKENQLTKPKDKIISGRYLSGSNEILVADKLANYLNIKPNDTLALISQGYHGASASGLFVVAGIIKIPNPDLSKTLVYMNLKDCQHFFQARGQLTSLVINLNNGKLLHKTINALKNKIDLSNYEVKSYEEISPELIQQIRSDEASGLLMLAILYLIVGFGVFGTLMMMMAERRREFGVMVAVGMQKLKLGALVALEMTLMAFIGIITGIAGSFPLIYYLYKNPIVFTGSAAESYINLGFDPKMPAAIEGRIFIIQSLVVLLIFIIAIILPLYNIIRIKEIKALKA